MDIREIDFSSLSVPQRILLAEILWDSVKADPQEVPVTEEQRQELKRRVAALDAGEMQTASWEEVRARLQALLA